MPKSNSIRPVVLIQCRPMTDGRTDGHITTAYTALSQRRAEIFPQKYNIYCSSEHLKQNWRDCCICILACKSKFSFATHCLYKLGHHCQRCQNIGLHCLQTSLHAQLGITLTYMYQSGFPQEKGIFWAGVPLRCGLLSKCFDDCTVAAGSATGL